MADHFTEYAMLIKQPIATVNRVCGKAKRRARSSIELLETRALLSSVLPAGWTDLDIGSVGKPGTASYDATTKVWTVAGCGWDIWNKADQFNFASESFNGATEPPPPIPRPAW